MRAAICFSLLACLVAAAPAGAATVSSDGSFMHVTAAPGEQNAITIFPEGEQIAVADAGAPLVPGPGCLPALTLDRVTCTPAASVNVSAGDLDDSVEVYTELPARVVGGDGDDQLSSGPGADVLDGGRGDDTTDAGAGNDSIIVRDRKADTAYCGDGRDKVRAEVLDSLDFSCERVDYGPPGRIGRLRSLYGGGRFVPIPGQNGARIDRRILKSVLYLIRRYRVRIGDGYAMHGHSRAGEHPLGLAVDITPGPGGGWRQVDRVAKWAEPRQNRPRPPFRWVGYNGDYNHGRGNHLHLSWQHSPGRPGRPVRRVWTWVVKRGNAAAASLAGPPMRRPPGYPAPSATPDF